LLSGWGGDELISHHGHAIFCDLFVNKKFTILLNELKLIASHSKKPLRRVLSTIYRRIFIPLMPTQFYCCFPKIHCTKFDFSIIHPKLHKHLKDELANKNYIFARHTSITVHNYLLRAWDNGHIQGRIESWHNASFAYKFEYRYPLLDRTIIEFALSSPGEYFYYTGIGRYIFKKANVDILPHYYSQQNFKREINRVHRIKKLHSAILYKLLKKYPFFYLLKSKVKEKYSLNELHIVEYSRVDLQKSVDNT
jgi:asparagine synthase (glutamine-hydrolysing)